MEYNAFRRSVSTGLALVGAGAISFATVAAMPAQQVATATGGVSAEVRPVALAGYAQTLAAGAVATIQQSLDGLLNDAPALWNQVTAQWPDADLTHWNYALVTDAVLAPLAPLVIGPFNDAVAEVLAQQFPDLQDEIRQLPSVIEYGVVRLVGPVLSAIGGAGAAHAQIFYSMTTLELQPFFEAVAAAPVHVIDGLLFGGYGDLRPLLTGEVGGEPIPAPGLLTPWGQNPASRPIKWAPDSTLTLNQADADQPAETATELKAVTQRIDAAPEGVAANPDRDAVETVTASTIENSSVDAPADATPWRRSVLRAGADTPHPAIAARARIARDFKEFRAGLRENVKKLGIAAAGEKGAGARGPRHAKATRD